ncbi:hypothetical protein Vretimale_14787 [Volvox reticuliferus]|nr:hypothetical protein Vretifemale_20392 [Volvox reticuliferus]GIM11254.1 hypothetical protein Vretimale_14787 [Volvox reticuliferus]
MLQYLPAAIKFLDAALGPTPAATAATAEAAVAEGAAVPTTATGPVSAAAPEVKAGETRSTSITAPPPADARPPCEAIVRQSGSAAGGDGAVSGGRRVLVHCQAGVSRSPAVVAGWLMRSRGLSADEALSYLVSRRSCVDPNEGFRAQLSLFGDMRCSLDPEHPVYRMWCLEELAGKWEDQGYVDPVAFAQLPEGPAGLSAAVAAQQTLYRCRKCRQLLATSAHVMPVEAALGHRIFRDRQRQRQTWIAGGGGAAIGGGGNPADAVAADTSGAAESCLFLAPMQWMSSSITGVVAGKLHCPNCSARLGSFDWSGISNPSGAWVTPAFQLHLSKLDTVLPKPLEALANVRRPLVGPMRSAATPVAAAAASSSNSVVAAPSVAAVAPSLPATLPAAVRRLGLGRAGAGEADEGEEQLPEPNLILDPDTANAESSPKTLKTSTHESQDVPIVVAGGPGNAAQVCSSGCSTAWFTHLILDCDGVLVDSEAASCEALRRAILEVTGFDIPHLFPQDYVMVFGMDVRSCVAHYREYFNRSDWEAPELLAPRVQAAKEVHYKKLTESGVPAFDGAERLIRRALDAGMQVGVASSGAPEKIEHNLSSSGLAPLIPRHAIVSASHVAAGKPAPDVYLAAMKATGCLDPRKALVVEDAVNGLKAARAAGMFTVGITNQLPTDILAPWSDLVVSHLDEVDPAGLTHP